MKIVFPRAEWTMTWNHDRENLTKYYTTGDVASG